MTTTPTLPSPQPQTTIRVQGADTGGRVALIETVEVRGKEPPCHQHQWEDEVLYVLAGELAVCVRGTWTAAPQGTTVLIPCGAEHGFAVLSDTALILTTFAPAGFEGFYRDADQDAAWADTTPLAIERMLATAAHYGCAITGPRLGPPVPPCCGQEATRSVA
jgi:quercetin dioxygenase-like cupin family protein